MFWITARERLFNRGIMNVPEPAEVVGDLNRAVVGSTNFNDDPCPPFSDPWRFPQIEKVLYFRPSARRIPGFILRLPSTGIEVLIFPEGKIVAKGARSVEDAASTVQMVASRLEGAKVIDKPPIAQG